MEILFLTNPSGAVVEIGIKSVDGAWRYGTGRIAGKTPVTAEVLESDFEPVLGGELVWFQLTLDGYQQHEAGANRDELEKNHLLRLEVTLYPLP